MMLIEQTDVDSVFFFPSQSAIESRSDRQYFFVFLSDGILHVDDSNSTVLFNRSEAVFRPGLVSENTCNIWDFW